MKNLFIGILAFGTAPAFATTITQCSYQDLDHNTSVQVDQSHIYTSLSIDTSWSHRDDCPTSIGVKFKTSTGFTTEYHSLSRSEYNEQKNTQACFYESLSKTAKKVQNMTCVMSL